MPRPVWRNVLLTVVAATGVLVCGTSVAQEAHLRVATYNASLYRNWPGQLYREIKGGRNPQARSLAEVIQRVRPDILLVNEFDYDAEGKAAQAFISKYLAISQNGCPPIVYPYHFIGPVNTGRPSGRDLNKNGKPSEPDDAVGFGRHEGQYGLLVLSKYPIDKDNVRTFRNFLWRDMPNAMLPTDPATGKPYYDDEDLGVLRLSSKSHFDVPIQVPADGKRKSFVLHLLASHPTPPVFDGPEDRNGRRNHDEVRLWADYIDPLRGKYLVDDAGQKGGLPADVHFVIVGDLNSDPIDGDSVPGTMDQLLKHERVNATFTPTSEGGPHMVKQHADQHADRHGDPANVTSNFTKDGHGCLRVDYALPSRGLKVLRGGVFWPPPGEPGSTAITATDHRLVWVDVRPE